MIKMFAVYDSKAAAFATPIFLPTRGLALRGFSDAVANPQSVMNAHPADYTLYELGEYDPNSGKVTCVLEPVHLFAASSVVAQLKGTRVVAADPAPVLGAEGVAA